VYLFVSGRTSKARGHFAIFIPNASDEEKTPSKTEPCTGTVIHVVGNPMIGFSHEFKRNYNTSDDLKSLVRVVLLGHIQESLHVDSSSGTFSTDVLPLGPLDAAALQVPVPGRSDVRAPVDGVSVLVCVMAFLADVTVFSGGQQTLPGVDHGVCPVSGLAGVLGKQRGSTGLGST
jgi:hypothetical protein